MIHSATCFDPTGGHHQADIRNILRKCTHHILGWDSSVGIATGYGLDGPGIESRWWRRDFPHLSDRPWGPPNRLYKGYLVFPEGRKRPGRDADPSFPSSAIGHERVELYLYSPYGPYGLYRASVPVQGCTLYFLRIILWKRDIRYWTRYQPDDDPPWGRNM